MAKKIRAYIEGKGKKITIISYICNGYDREKI